MNNSIKMTNLKFPASNPSPRRTWTTFFYGMCSEDNLTNMIKEAEDDGCEFVQIMAGMIPPPPSAVALPGSRPGPVPVLRLLVRMRDEDYAALLEKNKAKTPKGVLIN